MGSNKYMLFGIVGLAALSQAYRYDNQNIVVLLSLLTIAGAYYLSNHPQFIKPHDKPLILDHTHQKSSIIRKPLPTNHYKIYRHITDTKYSYRIKDYKELIESLSFVYAYDSQIIDTVKAICEAFFKCHFNIMLGEYEVSLFVDDLHDLKEMALEKLRELFFVLPKVSTIVNIPDLDNFVRRKILKLNIILSKYIRIVHHAFPEEKIKRYYEPPFERSDAL